MKTIVFITPRDARHGFDSLAIRPPRLSSGISNARGSCFPFRQAQILAVSNMSMPSIRENAGGFL